MHKACVQCHTDFVLDPNDLSFYSKMNVPEPTLCPRCRRLRRLSWLNDYVLYNRECLLCKKNFISMYAKNNVKEVLCPKCFHSDAWDPEKYAVEYNPEISFFEQFGNLVKSIPMLGVVNDDGIGSVNCLYNNDIGFSKNCTMCFVSWKMENCMNSFYLCMGKDLFDCHGVIDMCEFTYEGVMIEQVNRSKFMYWSSSCTDCAFGYDLRGCTDCFMCFGLRNKQYYFKNQKYSHEEYQKIIDSYKLNTRVGQEHAKKEFEEFLKTKPRKFAEMRQAVASSGTDIHRSKNTRDTNYGPLSIDSRYCANGVNYISCYDCSGGGETELSYECVTPDQSYNSIGTIKSWKNRNISYCIDCHSCEEVFGCVGVKKGTHMILNKRYTKEAYTVLKAQIISDMRKRGEYGEFFPTMYSPLGINETRAYSELNLSRDEAIAQGYTWQDELQQTRGKETTQQKGVSNAIEYVTDSITDEVLACASCARNYKILPDELTFYRRMKIPIPDHCFFCRMQKREDMRGGFDLNKRTCDCTETRHIHEGRCTEDFQTFFTTDKESRHIYCETCYQQVLE
jgi:hypothetical protein